MVHCCGSWDCGDNSNSHKSETNLVWELVVEFVVFVLTCGIVVSTVHLEFIANQDRFG